MKLAVFDLDGTIYLKNSHIEFLNHVYGRKFDNLFFKVFAFFLPKAFQKYIDFKYSKADLELINSLVLDYRQSAIDLIRDKLSQGYKVIIISNAPYELVRNASNRLGVDFFSTPVGRKHEALDTFDYTYLFVCTDNITDMSILKLADECLVYTRNNKRKFTTLSNVSFEEV